jgi:hypothetical protein
MNYDIYYVMFRGIYNFSSYQILYAYLHWFISMSHWNTQTHTQGGQELGHNHCVFRWCRDLTGGGRSLWRCWRWFGWGLLLGCNFATLEAPWGTVKTSEVDYHLPRWHIPEERCPLARVDTEDIKRSFVSSHYFLWCVSNEGQSLQK